VEFLADAPSFANTAGGEGKDLSQQDMPSRPKAAIVGEGVEETEMTEERRTCKYVVQCAPTRTASHHWKLADVVKLFADGLKSSPMAAAVASGRNSVVLRKGGID
jgi:hypothetical protein